MGTKQSKALLSFTRSSPFSFRHSATRVLGTAHTASPEGSTPACMSKHKIFKHGNNLVEPNCKAVGVDLNALQ
jgi:hypothetical protein